MQNTKRRNLLVIALGVIASLLIGIGCVTLNKTSAFASANVADDGYDDYYIFTIITDESSYRL
ncbi:MAG: hypothetical protein NC131_13340 [Roseburia sp.]|nr:hypothetical protein [Roseburia sp.]